MSDKIVIELDEGKYEYVFENGVQTIKRHGEAWRNETGDNFILAMAMRIEELEKELSGGMEETINVIKEVVSKNPTTCDSRLTDFLVERGLL